MPRVLTRLDGGSGMKLSHEGHRGSTEDRFRSPLCILCALCLNQGSSAMIIGVRALEGRKGAIKLSQQMGFIAGGDE